MVRSPRELSLLVLTVAILLSSSAWAGVGWYLVMPPEGVTMERIAAGDTVGAAEDHVHAQVPLRQWTIDAAFDSAAACERENKARKAESVRLLTAKPAERPAWLPDNFYVTAVRILLSACITSDDPRLNPSGPGRR